MAITQPSLIGWQAVEASPDIKRLQLVLDHLDDEKLMRVLEAERGNRRNDYPIRAVWNTLFAGLILGHFTYQSLRRELCRNAELRQALGYDPMLGPDAVPGGWVVSRLLSRLVHHQELVEQIFRSLVSRVFIAIPTFGTHMAVDGKAIKSLMTRDGDATVGVKTTTDALEAVVHRWFGFKIHCLCDVATELPIAFEVTKASAAESPQFKPLVAKAMGEQPRLAKRAKSIAADKGLDDGNDKLAVYTEYGIAPIIPARDLAKGEMKPLGAAADTIYTSPTGDICCLLDPANPDPAKRFAAMAHQGFEPERMANRFQCPAAALGIICHNQHNCRSKAKDKGKGRTVRVKIEDNPRLNLPIHQHSRLFEKLYRGRTSIERLFYRLDHLFGMEAPLRSTGLAKAKLRVTLAMSAMVATAVGWLAENREDMVRSRLQSAAA
jgi:hypothetical protein